MTEQDITVEINGNKIEKVHDYTYPGHTTTLGKQNQTAEIRILIIWTAVVLQNSAIWINSCISACYDIGHGSYDTYSSINKPIKNNPKIYRTSYAAGSY